MGKRIPKEITNCQVCGNEFRFTRDNRINLSYPRKCRIGEKIVCRACQVCFKKYGTFIRERPRIPFGVEKQQYRNEKARKRNCGAALLINLRRERLKEMTPNDLLKLVGYKKD